MTSPWILGREPNPRARLPLRTLLVIASIFLPAVMFAAESTETDPAPVAASAAKLKITDRLSCSTLCQCKQPTATAFKVIAGLGYRWIELSCLNWAPHVSVPQLVQDFDAEASRVEALLKQHQLRVSDLVFDAVETRPFDQYEKEFAAVLRLAVRLEARLINIMAPSTGAERTDQVAKLRKLQATAASNRVILTVETHCNQITELPADAAWLCRQVPGLGLTLDPSHYFAGPNQGKAFAALYPLVRGTGLRAGGMSWDTIQLPWGEGPINFAAVIRDLEGAGYRGFYVVEYIEGFNSLDAVEQSRRFLDWARAL